MKSFTRTFYSCEYCKAVMDNKSKMAEHETQCKRDKELEEYRRLHKEHLDIFKQNFNFENIQDVINAYVGPMYDDCFPIIKMVSSKFRLKVSIKEKYDEKYNNPIFGKDFKPGFTGQIYGRLSKRGKTLADYKELCITLDKFSSNEKGWNSGFRIFCEDFDQLAYLHAKHMLVEK